MNWFGRKKENNKPSAISATTNNRTNGGGAGGGGGATITSTANTVVNLRENIATQEKREAHLEKKIELLTVEAKAKMAKKDKKGVCSFFFVLFYYLLLGGCVGVSASQSTLSGERYWATTLISHLWRRLGNKLTATLRQ
jgi:hypothetical protein